MAILPYIMAGISIATLLVNRARIAILLLFGQYLIAAVISSSSLPIRTISARLIGGLLVCAILYSTTRRVRSDAPSYLSDSIPRSLWLRLITAIIIFIVAWAFGNQNELVPASLTQVIFAGAIFNIFLGSLMVGMYQSPLEAAIGLLTLLIGFDLFYGGIEPSLAIVVLMISIQLIISLATSYLMSVATSLQHIGEVKD